MWKTTKTRIGDAARARLLAVFTVGALMTSCTTVPADTEAQALADSINSPTAESHEVESCRLLFDAAPPASAAGLNTDEIRLVSWNMQKKSIPNWRADYSRLTDGRDLILIQEASLRVDTVGDLPAAPHWSFAPGYRTGESITGVLTLSSSQPLARCSFSNKEPLLRTPKATSITQFALEGSDETLLVVNVHAVNFSLGLGSYKRQFAQISDVLEGHQGPIILSGDFNTWRAGRTRTIEAMAEKLELLPIVFSDDNRTRFLGSPLDHIYVRGLTASNSDASVVTSSDHNPLTVTLGM
jgi:endonuclease/exonuclease/phosphatase (EEP) superfamily protein YafD